MNQLTGNIPTGIGNLTTLKYLSINNNQFSGSVPVEIGDLVNLESLLLNNNNFAGAIPAQITNLLQLKYFSISNNLLIDLPGLSSLTALENLEIENNRFTFEDIESNVGIASASFIYSPQDSAGLEIDTTLDAESDITISVSVAGTANQYQWMKDGIDIVGADSSSYTISSASSADSGAYICKITNTIATQLTIYSRPINVTVIDITGVADPEIRIPDQFTLWQNYPNPFNPSTTIRFVLPEKTKVKIEVYNALGGRVNILLDRQMKTGFHKIEFNAQNLPSGIYIYKITAGYFFDVKKMLYLK